MGAALAERTGLGFLVYLPSTITTLLFVTRLECPHKVGFIMKNPDPREHREQKYTYMIWGRFLAQEPSCIIMLCDGDLARVQDCTQHSKAKRRTTLTQLHSHVSSARLLFQKSPS